MAGLAACRLMIKAKEKRKMAQHMIGRDITETRCGKRDVVNTMDRRVRDGLPYVPSIPKTTSWDRVTCKACLKTYVWPTSAMRANGTWGRNGFTARVVMGAPAPIQQEREENRNMTEHNAEAAQTAEAATQWAEENPGPFCIPDIAPDKFLEMERRAEARIFAEGSLYPMLRIGPYRIATVGATCWVLEDGAPPSEQIKFSVHTSTDSLQAAVDYCVGAAQTAEEPDWFRYVSCGTCGSVESQPADEQRWHFGSFTFQPDTEGFVCNGCGAVVQEDIADQNLE